MSEVIALRQLANAIANLQDLESFSFDASSCTGMQLSWSQGSCTAGYKELSRAMSECMRGPMWREVRRMAIDEAKAKIEVARRNLHEAQSAPVAGGEG